MENKMFWEKYEPTEQKGKLLLITQALLHGTQTPLKVHIHDHLILFNDWCMKYSFDIKFLLTQQNITFQLHDTEEMIMTFELVKEDAQEWYLVLREKLNQKGFLETFKPRKKIGKGSFATVYLVERIQTGEEYAVKAFSKELAYGEQKGKQCLIKEIQIMRCLKHPNIMQLVEVFESDNSLYLIFDFMQGGQLLTKVEEKYTFSEWEVQTIMRCLLEATTEIHSHGIMHRDLKPENILFREQGSIECAIADFGLAEFSESEQYLFVRCGTPGYVAPEVINIKDMTTKYTTACDIFSLGAIFHLLLTRKPLFKAKKNDQLVKENRVCEFDFEDIQGKFSSQAINLMKKMLQIKPEERINAKQALSHAYFKQAYEKKVTSPKKKNFLEVPKKEGMIFVSPNKKPKEPIKDSCLEFKMAKENVLTGQTKTVNDVGNTKVSMFGKALEPGRVSKISKFSKPAQCTQ